MLTQKKRHVLFIVENLSVPRDPRVWTEALTLKEWGYTVTIISPKDEYNTRNWDDINGINIYRHVAPSKTKGKLAFIFEYINALFWELFLAIRIYINKPFHIIHAANPPDTICLIALLFKLFRVKYIFDHHDLSLELYLIRCSGKNDVAYKTLLLFEKISCKLVDVIISTNKPYRRIVMSRYKIDSEQLFIVRNDPISRGRLSIKSDNDRCDKGNKKVILYLGSINLQDGVDFLTRALHYLVNGLNRNDFVCSVIGDGDSLQFVKQIAKELQLMHFVDFKGYIHEKEKIIEFLYSSDICVEPASDNELNKHSTFIKIMEYISAAKPIVAFDLAENRYSAKDSALFVKPGDIIGFAKAINELIEKPQLREKLGRIGRNRVETELNWNNASQTLQRVYDFIFIEGIPH